MGDAAPAESFKRVVIEPAYTAVSAAIERAMVDEDLLPGTALPNEQALLKVNFDAGLTESDLPALVALGTGLHALVGRASHNRALLFARESISLLYNTALLQIFKRPPQSRERNVTAHRNIMDALQRREDHATAQWTYKHMIDFQRGFALAGLDMSTSLVKSK